MFNVEFFAATRESFYAHTWELYFDGAKVLHSDCGLRMFFSTFCKNKLRRLSLVVNCQLSIRMLKSDFRLNINNNF